MAGYFLAMGVALWFGIQTAVSPCPMATNIAAVSFIGRRVSSPGQVLLAGLLYAVGRTLAYVALAALLVGSLLASSSVSAFLQKHMTQVLGPVLIVVGMFLLEMIQLNFSGPGVSETMQKRVEALGLWGALPLGLLFALSFCPWSAFLFFVAFIPVAIERQSAVLLPSLYGLGTALPVVAFAVLIAFSTQAVGKAFNMVTQFEWWARRITGLIFLVVGVLFSLEYCFSVPVMSLVGL